jgi:hypothetical protein
MIAAPCAIPSGVEETESPKSVDGPTFALVVVHLNPDGDKKKTAELQAKGVVSYI